MRLSIRSIINKHFAYLFLFSVFAHAGLAETQELNEFGNSDHFDFSRTNLTIIFNQEKLSTYYWPPFEAEPANVGVLVYAMLLKYADRFERGIQLQEQPEFHIVILGSGQIRNYYLGDQWLEFEDSIAFMNGEDYLSFANLIRERFERGANDTLAGEFHIANKLAKQSESTLSTRESLKYARKKMKKLFENNRDERWDIYEPKMPLSLDDLNSNNKEQEKPANDDYEINFPEVVQEDNIASRDRPNQAELNTKQIIGKAPGNIENSYEIQKVDSNKQYVDQVRSERDAFNESQAGFAWYWYLVLPLVAVFSYKLYKK